MSKAAGIDQTTRDFKKDSQPSIDAVLEAYKTVVTSENNTTWSYICLGKALLDCRRVLMSGFKDHITVEKTEIEDKQVRRYMRLVACPSCYEDLSKPPNKNDGTKLKIDSNIETIKEEDIGTLKNPSMNKISRMKEMFYLEPNDKNKKEVGQVKKDFREVIEGDDTKYDDKIKKQKEEKEAVAKKEKETEEKRLKKEFLGAGMTVGEYEKFKLGGNDTLKEIIAFKKEKKEMEDEIKNKNDDLERYAQELKTHKDLLAKIEKEYPNIKELLKKVA